VLDFSKLPDGSYGLSFAAGVPGAAFASSTPAAASAVADAAPAAGAVPATVGAAGGGGYPSFWSPGIFGYMKTGVALAPETGSGNSTGAGSIITPGQQQPALPAYDGQTTKGILVTNEGASIPFSSGGGDPMYSNYVAASHVEGQAALWFSTSTSTGGTLYINNINGICGYCDAQLETLLPPGVVLQVVPPANASANNSRSVAYPTTYVGNSNPPKPKQ